MELRTLKAFVEVIRQGGFSAAAKVLFSTQSTVTKSVQQLEQDVGALLIQRIGHTVRLTDAGLIVYQRALAILGERDHLLADIAELKGLRRGTLRIGLPPIGSGVLFAPMFAEFRQQYPDIDIVLEEHGGARLKELVQNREIDIGATLLPVEDALDGQALCDEPMMALLPHDHPLAERDSIRLQELENSPLILFEKGFSLNLAIESACRRRGFVPIEAARSGQPDFIVALVAAGLGVAMLPRLMVDGRVHPSVHLALIDDEDLRWRLGMVWRRGAYLSSSARAWLELAEDFARRSGLH